ncbi:hypothetical protein CYY_001762 [Polysphondylium violaceum]|uniref:WD40 repeat-containing protein n=1 Tax=Polysphondylium violaceum TaxID=133409 RepID=A0A8J4Q183_9MYCE|nr:hypothetical protein CYY_001762 [Polysphondylium violaceum]
MEVTLKGSINQERLDQGSSSSVVASEHIRKCDTPLRVVGVQEDSPCAWAPDGSRFAFVSGNGSIYITKENDDGNFIVENVLAGHTHTVNCLLFHPTEPIFVSGGFEGIIVWDLLSGFIIKKMISHIDPDAHDARIECLYWLYEGTSLVSGSKDSNIKVWDSLRKFELIETITGHKAPVTCFNFAPQLNILASAGRDQSIKIWDVSTLKPEFRSKREDDSSIKVSLDRTFDGHRGDVISLIFNKDGSLLFSGARDNEIKIWSTKLADDIRSIKYHKGDVTQLNLLSKDTVLISASVDGTVKCIKLARTKNVEESEIVLIEELKNELTLDSSSIHSDPFLAIPSSPEDEKDTILYSFEPHEGTGISGFRFSPNSQFMATSSEHSVRIWKISTNLSEKPVLYHEFVGHKGPVNSVFLLPDSEFFLSGSTDYSIFLYNMKTLKKEADFNFEGSVYTLTVGTKADQSVVFAGGNHYDIKGFCISRNSMYSMKEVVRYSGHCGKVSAISLNPDCTLLASGGHDFDICIWSVKMPFVFRDESIVQKPIAKYSDHKGHITALCFNENGKYLISAGTDHSLIIWEVGSNKKLSKHRNIEQAHSSVVSCVIFGKGQNSAFFFTASWDGTIKIWDLASKKPKPVGEIKAHNSRISSLATSSDGEVLISACSDGNIKTWKASRPWTPISEYIPNDNGSTNAISSNEHTFVTGSDNGMIRCWPHFSESYSDSFK